jgi:broad specificity phosphatase PhoE
MAFGEDPSCRRLYLIRHGETLYGNGPEGGLPGRELTERGYRQIEALAELLADVRLDAIYASPLGRAQATAETIARRNGATVTTVEELREIETGNVPGGGEMAEIFAAVRAFFASPETDWDTPYLGGETYRQLRERVWPLFEAGRLKPTIYRVFPLEQAAEAHALMESSQHIGKIMLAVHP